MDQELKAYLDAMQESLVTRMVDLNKDTREHAEGLQAHAMEHADHLHGAAMEHADHLHGVATEYAEHLHGVAMEHADQLHVQARVLIESVDAKVGLVWEGVQAIKGTLNTKLADQVTQGALAMPRRPRNPSGFVRKHPDTSSVRWQGIVKCPDPGKPGAWKQRSAAFDRRGAGMG